MQIQKLNLTQQKIIKDTEGLDNVLATELIRFGDIKGENIEKAKEYYKNTIKELREPQKNWKKIKQLSKKLKEAGIDINKPEIENLEKINIRTFLILEYTLLAQNICYTEPTRTIICFFGSTYSDLRYYRPLNHSWNSHSDIFREYENIIQKSKQISDKNNEKDGRFLETAEYNLICKYDDSALWFYNDNTSIQDNYNKLTAKIYKCKNCKSGYKALVGEKYLNNNDDETYDDNAIAQKAYL
ncbi:hypothetical protein OQH61_04970 [Helicobacter sp. MIT 21-1697]|uniref:hypothetical protein n=1 Tax=Helicobacter sp. MIT 21-1697 TaxID=2993733 RepID=UPI00224A8D81|nr:hypothetical protein [Helicobacter sp. MIT 21-1697]MCX2717084.1 hypothetical protein [Helicobacter sp. MIT 21-1697]